MASGSRSRSPGSDRGYKHRGNHEKEKSNRREKEKARDRYQKYARRSRSQERRRSQSRDRSMRERSRRSRSGSWSRGWSNQRSSYQRSTYQRSNYPLVEERYNRKKEKERGDRYRYGREYSSSDDERQSWDRHRGREERYRNRGRSKDRYGARNRMEIVNRMHLETERRYKKFSPVRSRRSSHTTDYRRWKTEKKSRRDSYTSDSSSDSTSETSSKGGPPKKKESKDRDGSSDDDIEIKKKCKDSSSSTSSSSSSSSTSSSSSSSSSSDEETLKTTDKHEKNDDYVRFPKKSVKKSKAVEMNVKQDKEEKSFAKKSQKSKVSTNSNLENPEHEKGYHKLLKKKVINVNRGSKSDSDDNADKNNSQKISEVKGINESSSSDSEHLEPEKVSHTLLEKEVDVHSEAAKVEVSQLEKVSRQMVMKKDDDSLKTNAREKMPARAPSKMSVEKEAAESSDADSENLDCEKIVSKLQDEKLFDRSDIDIEESDPLKVSPTLSERKDDESSDNGSEDSSLGKASYEMAMKKTGESLNTKAEAYEPGNASLEMIEKKADESLDSICKDSDSFKGSEDYVQILEESSEFISEKFSPNQTLNEKDKETGEITDSDDSESEENPHENLTETNANDNAELDSEDQDERAGEMSNDEKSEGKEPSSELQFEVDLEQEKLDEEVQTNLTEVSSCDPNDSQIVSRSDKESEEATEESLDGNQDGLVSIGHTDKNSESVRDVELCTVVKVDINSEKKEIALQNEDDESIPQENLESDAELRSSEVAKTSCEKIIEMSDSGGMPVDLGKSELKTTKGGDEPSDHKRGKKHKKHKAKRSSSSSEGDEDSKKNDMQVVYNSDSDETSEQELLRKKKQLEEQLQIEEEIRQSSKSQERERDNARSKKLMALNSTEGSQENSSPVHSKKSSSKDNTSRSRSRSHSQSRHDSKIEDRKNKKNNDKSSRSDKRPRYHSSGDDDDDDDSAVQQESEEPQIGGQYWEADHGKDTPRHQKGKQPKTSDTYWNKYADKLGIQIEDPKSKGQGTDRGRDRDRNDEKRREMWSNSAERRHRAGSDESEGKNFKRRKDEQNDIVGQKNESKEPELRAKELIKKPVIDPLSTKTGGAYIPPAKLKMMQAEITDKSSPAFQRLAWEALKKSINGLVNKVNVSNIGIIVRELLKENIVRGRGVLCRALMQAQSFSPTFTHVYAAMVAIINSKFPQIGELLLKRLVIQLRRGVKRNDKNVCVSSCRFIAHLINQQVAHEVVALEILTFLLERAKDVTDDSEVAEKSRNNSCELAITFLTECGMKLNEVSPRGMKIILETLRNVLHEGKLEQRVAYMLEVIFAIVKDGFKDHPSVIEELDLVEEDDQFTHIVELDGKLDAQDILNVFRHDPEYEDNEEKYKEIRAGILGDESDESGSEAGSESGSESDDEESEDENEKQDAQTILDQTETNMVAFRRTVYLTIQSSLDVDECAHKLLKGEIKPGWEAELCNMILDCCAQQRTYIKFYGLLAQRFCMINKAYQEPFQQIFQDAYDTCHRLETEKLRNVARLFAHLLFSDAISWEVLSHVHLNEDETTSSSRVFIKILFQELAEFMSLAKLNERLRDPTLAPAFEGLLPRDNPRNTRFAINFFTSCGLGGLTDDLREFLRTQPKPTAVVAPVQQQINKNDGNKSNSDTSSDTSSDSDSSSSSSSSTSSTTSSTSSSSSESTSESTGDTSDSSLSDSEDSSGSEDEKRRKKKWKREAKRKSTSSKNKSRNVRKSERSREIKGTNKDKSDSEEKEVSDDQKERERRDRWRNIHTDDRSRRRRDDSSESGERENDRYEWDERRRGYTYARGDRREVENAEKRERHEGVYDIEERRRSSDDRARIDLRKVEEEETGYLRRREEKKEQKRRYNSGDDNERHQRRNDSGDRGEKRKKRHDSRERDSKRKRSEFEDRAKDDDKGVEHWKQDFSYQRGEYGRQNEVRDHQEWKEQIKEVRDGEWRKDKKIYGHRSESGSDGRRGWERHHFH